LEIGERPLPPNSRLDSFIDFGKFKKDEDKYVGSSTLNDTIRNTTYNRENIPSINSKKSESLQF